MTDPKLEHRRILVVEDEYLIADNLHDCLGQAGAVVVGPVGTVEQAVDAIEDEAALDGAILDLNLNGEMTFGVADLLLARDVPFVFTTGYDASVIPSRYANIARCQKPFSMDKVAAMLGQALHGAS